MSMMKANSQPVHSGISRNVLAFRTHRNLRESSGNVTWRDVTLCHSISGSPVLPGTTRHYHPILPG
eukprot:1360130-Amorphochlora_amoeboformis.AAC.1